jgi:hypothetical protein
MSLTVNELLVCCGPLAGLQRLIVQLSLDVLDHTWVAVTQMIN